MNKTMKRAVLASTVTALAFTATTAAAAADSRSDRFITQSQEQGGLSEREAIAQPGPHRTAAGGLDDPGNADQLENREGR